MICWVRFSAVFVSANNLAEFDFTGAIRILAGPQEGYNP